MKLIIIRGPSGSGKSTIAKALGGIAEKNWFEADMYMITKDGEYKWSADKLRHAHKWCYDMLRQAILSNEYDRVIVSDTSTRLSEAQVYVDLAKELDIDYEIIRTPGPWNMFELTPRNTHGVSADVIMRQMTRYVQHVNEYEWTNMEIFNVSHNG